VSLNTSAFLLHHLEESFVTYLTIAQTSSVLLANQSMSIKSLTSQIISLNDMVEQKILHLRLGFDRLEELLLSTEEQISSWGGNKSWILAGLAGIMIGTTVGMWRWLFIGMSVTPLR
jgi:hypothetical protein